METIILDFGHRRDTPGKRFLDFHEWEFNHELGRVLFDKLIEKNYKVEVTCDCIIHPFDETTKQGRADNLKFRVNNANEINEKSLFISIHANAHSDSNVSGYEIYIPSSGKGGSSERLAEAILEGAKVLLGVGDTINNRGIKIEDFYVLKYTNMPAVLIEHGFYTNSEEREKMKTKEFKDKAADSIMMGIERYMNKPQKNYDILSRELESGDILYYFNKKSLVKSEFYQPDIFDKNIRLIKADPHNIGIIIGYNNVKSTGYNGVNGTFFWEENKKIYHSGIIVIEDKILWNYASRNQYWDKDELNNYPQSVLCFYKDNTFGIEKVKYATEISKSVWWAIGGIGLISGFGYNPESEGFVGLYTDVLRKTNHTSIGVIENNKVILARSYNVYRKDTVDHMKGLGCKYAIGLDSGESCQIVTPKWKRPSWIARKVSNMIVVTDL